jgi:hypothetical protein
MQSGELETSEICQTILASGAISLAHHARLNRQIGKLILRQSHSSRPVDKPKRSGLTLRVRIPHNGRSLGVSGWVLTLLLVFFGDDWCKNQQPKDIWHAQNQHHRVAEVEHGV